MKLLFALLVLLGAAAVIKGQGDTDIVVRIPKDEGESLTISHSTPYHYSVQLRMKVECNGLECKARSQYS